MAQPCLAPPHFRLHTWHSEREANPSSQPRSGRAGRGERGGTERGRKLRVSRVQRDRTGENWRKGTKQAVGCDRKINTYNVLNSQALFLFSRYRSEAAVQFADGLSQREKKTYWAHDSNDKLIHLEDSYLFYCTYVCPFFKMTLLLITQPIAAPPSCEIDKKCPQTV